MSKDVKDLHVNRLQKALEAIPDLRNSNAFVAEFKEWQRMINHSLNQLFGPKHKYSHDFLSLQFWEFRISLGRRKWKQHDQERYEHDLTQAESILKAALEELKRTPAAEPQLMT